MSSVPELHLSQPFKLAQRVFSDLLDARRFDASLAMASRVRAVVLDKADLARLTRWLAWQTHVRNPQALARIERVDQRLAAGVLHALSRLPATDVRACPQVRTGQRKVSNVRHLR